jgi:hypothetical protein
MQIKEVHHCQWLDSIASPVFEQHFLSQLLSSVRFRQASQCSIMPLCEFESDVHFKDEISNGQELSTKDLQTIPFNRQVCFTGIQCWFEE